MLRTMAIFNRLLIVAFIIFATLVLQASTVIGSAITEGFGADEAYPAGSLVSLKKDNPEQVELANVNNASFIAGITTESTDGLLSLSNAAARLFVAVSGDSEVQVSTINGSIQKGDLLGPSQLNGFAQRTSIVDGGRIVGVALGDFDGNTGEQIEVNSTSVSVGIVPVRILLTEVAGNNDQSFIEKIGEAITGSEVSTIRVVISSLIFLAAIIVSAILLYSSVKGSFLSLGRNPLASESIFSSMLHVTFIALTVLIIGVGTAYLVMVL